MEKELSPEETTKKLEAHRKVCLANLKSGLWDYALPKLITPAQFGQVSQIAQAKYQQLISKVPAQDIYDKLFLPALSSDSGAVTSPYLQNTSMAILHESFGGIKAEDALAYLGSKKQIKESYKGKYIFELSEEERNNVIGLCMGYTINGKAADLLNETKKGIVSGLEQILTEDEKQEEKK